MVAEQEKNAKKLFEFKKWLNMEPITDKESRSCDDITFLSEIITNS